MIDLFELKNILPMLSIESDPFDSDDHIYELKTSGIRCIAYLDSSGTELRNKQNESLNYPELSTIHTQTNNRCILDGELVVMSNGKNPVKFVAFDILYVGDRQITDLRLLERKTYLHDIIRENDQIAISRFVHHKGIEFYNLALAQGLEGVVAKRKDSLYHMGTRTKNWVIFNKFHDS